MDEDVLTLTKKDGCAVYGCAETEVEPVKWSMSTGTGHEFDVEYPMCLHHREMFMHPSMDHFSIASADPRVVQDQ